MAQTIENEQLQFQYWIEFIRRGKFEKEYHIENFPDGYFTKEDGDEFLSNNMRRIMDHRDYDVVNQYEVIETGYNLVLQSDIPEPPKVVEVEKIVKVRGKERIVEKLVHAPTLDYIKLAMEGRPNVNIATRSHMPPNFPNRAELEPHLLALLKGRKILFLENDNCLPYSVGNFYRWTIEQKLDSFTLLNIRELPKEFIASKIIEYDTIAYQTTYLHEETRELVKFVMDLPIPKMILECSYESNFSKRSAPQHRIFALGCMEDGDWMDWRLTEVK